MGKLIKVDFEKNSLSDEERFKEEVQPILQDLVDVARHSFGNTIAIDMLSDVMGILYKYTSEETYILNIKNFIDETVKYKKLAK